MLLKVYFSKAIFFVSFIIIFFSIFSPYQYVSDIGLDSSWQNSYNYFFEHSLNFGPNVAFTYGPLAFIYLKAFSPDLYWWKILFSAGLAVIVCLIYWLIKQRSNTFIGLLFALSLILSTGYDS